MSDPFAVFVNQRRVLVPHGATAGVAAAQAADVDGLDPGRTLLITDARGLPVAPETVLAPGTILRVTASARRPDGPDADA